MPTAEPAVPAAGPDLNARLRHGIIPAMATPLQADGYGLNLAAVPALVEFLVAAGVKGLFVGGTTGEGVLLATDQRRRLHEATVRAATGRVAALVHVGANDTRTAVSLARHAAEIGADAIVAVTPFYYPMHDDGLLDYFQAIADAAPDTPLLAYDIPQQATNGVSPALLARLADTIPTLAGIKCSRPDAQTVRQLIDVAPGRVPVYAGNERVALGLLALGAAGLVLGLATAVPEPAVAMIRAFAAGDLVAALRHQRTVNRILDLLPVGARIGALKQILVARGIAAGPPVPPRPPAVGSPLWPQIAAILAEGRD